MFGSILAALGVFCLFLNVSMVFGMQLEGKE
jgi:hypothetical protein